MNPPLKLRNAPTQLMKKLNYGRDYKYPHDFQGHHVEESYLPDELVGQRYYQPSDQGYEKDVAKRLQERLRTREPGDETT